MSRKAAKVPTSQKIKTLRSRLLMTQHDFADLLGTATVTVARWEGNHSAPAPKKTIMLERLNRLLELLSEVIVEEDIPRWLVTPRSEFDGYRPAELLDNDFAFGKVEDLVESAKWGAYS